MWWYSYSRRREALDLLISWIVVTLAFSFIDIVWGNIEGIVANSVAVFLSFIVHELSHRATARRYGYIAFYRAWYIGIVLTIAVTVVSMGRIVFAAPGAVTVYGPWVDRAVEASIALSGPLSNILIAVVAAALNKLYPSLWMSRIASLNAWIAFFNLLPVPPLDGYKVFRGSIAKWVAVFVVSAILVFIS